MKTPRPFFLILLLFFSVPTHSLFGQTLRLQAGTSVSHIDWLLNGINYSYLDERITRLSALAGVEFMDKKYFSLSFNMGYIGKGGKERIALTDSIGNKVGEMIFVEHLNYFTMNTMIDFKPLPSGKFVPLVGIGPRIDLLFSNSEAFDQLKQFNDLNKFNYGVIVGGGFKYLFYPLQIGLRLDYYFNFGNVAGWPESPGRSQGLINDRTFSANFTIGYSLSKPKQEGTPSPQK